MGGTASAQTVLLNEIQVSNGITLVDENGDTPDWIELFNPGSSAVDLNGWGLSDSTNALFKWTFTNATIAPGGYMVVLASGKDRQPGAYPAVNPTSVGG
ncbi:MAG TPA: lamin tail domain-containing protein, partial [Candidatus Dormibacteraeota bacterium]|nr:lamin tail domain-containing protein [Candidatus Dormibacteraeota bacterium]